MKLLLPLLIFALPLASMAQSSSSSELPSVAIPKPSEVLVIVTPRQGVTAQQIIAVMPAEMRATLNLYLDGEINEWYSRGDGKGVILLVNVKTEDEARAMMQSLPLAKEQLVDEQYIPAGPLLPLRMLLRGMPAQQ